MYNTGEPTRRYFRIISGGSHEIIFTSIRAKLINRRSWFGMAVSVLGLEFTNYRWMPLVQLALAVCLILYVAVVRRKLRQDPANASLNL